MDTSIDSRAIDDPDGLPLKWHVRVFPDYDAKPDDYDCYDPAQVLAWKADEWEFVSVHVTPVLPDGTELDTFTDTLGATEWGSLPMTDDDGNPTGTRELDLDTFITEHPVPEMIANTRGELHDKLGALVLAIGGLQIALDNVTMRGSSGPN